MEISSFLHLTAKRVFMLILAAELAAVITGAVIYRRPTVYAAKGVVFVGQVFAQGTPDYALGPFSDDFRTSLTLEPVVKATAKASKESPGAIESKLAATSLDGTNNVQVSYSSGNAKAAVTVIDTASHKTLELLADNELQQAERARAAAEKAYVSSSNKQNEFESQNGTSPTDPALSITYRALQAQVDRDLTALLEAQSRAAAAQLQVDSASAPALVAIGTVSEQSKLPGVFRGALAAGALTAMTGVLLLAIPFRRRRPQPDNVAGRTEDETTTTKRRVKQRVTA